MPQEFNNENRLAAWKNNDKQNDKAADYTGTLNVDGQEFFLDIWINTIQSGERAGQKMLSGKVKMKNRQGGGNQQGGQQRQQPQQQSRGHSSQRSQGGGQNRPAPNQQQMEDDDIPF